MNHRAEQSIALKIFTLLLLQTMLLIQPQSVIADPGEPVAVRLWPQKTVSIESMWNLTVAVTRGAADDFDSKAEPFLAADLSIFMPNKVDGESENFRIRLPGKSAVEETATTFDYYLDRVPNAESPSCGPGLDFTFVSPNAIRARYIAPGAISVSVDGLQVLIIGNLGDSVEAFTASMSDASKKFDALVDISDTPSVIESMVAELKIPTLIRAAEAVGADGERATDDNPTGSAIGNTVALASKTWQENAADKENREQSAVRVLELQLSAWEMPEAVSELFAKKDRASRECEDVFSSLSVKQLNFTPSNGSHTPRWNAEHMMGRELLFFSQIFAKRTPAIKPIDLNPAQMPPDYKAAHADWDGKEEARQIARVTAFTRRFAYLLDGMDLEKKANGSFWTPRKLLEQMERHYDEHTANVVKKFELSDWPKE